MDEHTQCFNYAFTLCKKHIMSQILCTYAVAARKKVVLCVSQEYQFIPYSMGLSMSPDVI
jgi:hypothetical protein